MAKVIHIGIESGEIHMEDDNCNCWSKPYPYICRVMQYIGRNDKNGKEIYEGDIVKATKYNGMIVEGVMIFRDCAFCIKNDFTSVYNLMDYEIEVLGNIYEDKELLHLIHKFDEGGVF